MLQVYGSWQKFCNNEADHLCGRNLLAQGLQDIYGIKILPTMLAVNECGKPFLPAYPEVHFNLSHCHGLVVCAFADVPVGIDVETAVVLPKSIIKRALTVNEQQLLASYQTDPIQYWRVFSRIWSLKESYLKWSGKGLTITPKTCEFIIQPAVFGHIVSSQPGLAFVQKQLTPDTFLSLCIKKKVLSAVEIHWLEKPAA